MRGGDETILLVEDEAPVCANSSPACFTNTATTFCRPPTAEKPSKSGTNTKTRSISLLTDLVMPGNMNGRELAEKLWIEQPELKVIFTSGYSADIVGKDFKLEPELNFLQKPYHPKRSP